MPTRKQPATRQSTLVYFAREVDLYFRILFRRCHKMVALHTCVEQQVSAFNPEKSTAVLLPRVWCRCRGLVFFFRPTFSPLIACAKGPRPLGHHKALLGRMMALPAIVVERSIWQEIHGFIDRLFKSSRPKPMQLLVICQNYGCRSHDDPKKLLFSPLKDWDYLKNR